MIEYDADADYSGIFDTQEFNHAFDDLFKPEDSEGKIVERNGGPLYYILRDYATVLAKGGKGQFNPNNKYRDTTYFVHVLNLMLISGRALERSLKKNGFDLTHNESLIRVFFASCILHDINKLYPDVEEENLQQVISKHRLDIERFISGYIPDYKEQMPKIEFLILGTENKSRGAISTSNDPILSRNLSYLQMFITFGDIISSILAENKSPDIILKKVREKCKSDAYKDFAGEVDMILLNDRPQTMLRNLVLSSIESALSEGETTKRSIIAVSPASILYFSEGIDLEVVLSKASEKVEKFLKGKELYRAYEPTGKNFDSSFLSWITDSELDRYLEEYSNAFFMLENIDDILKESPDFVGIWNSRGFRVKRNDTNDTIKLTIDKCVKDAEGEDLTYTHLLFLFTLKRIQLMLEKKGKGSVTEKTTRSLDFAYNNLDKYDECFPELKREVMDKGKELYKNEPEKNGGKIVASFYSEPTVAQRGMSKKDSCLICGAEGSLEFRDTYAFGFNATAGTGRKISENRYTDKYKICSLCATEAELRMVVFEKKDKEGSVAVHLSIGDYVHPLDYTGVKSMMDIVSHKIDDRLSINGPLGKNTLDGKLSFIKEKDNALKVFFDYYHLTFLPLFSKSKKFSKTGGDKYVQFTYMEQLLEFVKASGFKVRISPLMSGSKLFEQMFIWENAPSWVFPLKLNDVRLDELDDRVKDIEDMEKVINLNGERDISSVLKVALGLSRSSFSIYRLARESILDRKDWKGKTNAFYPVVVDYAQRNARSEYMEIKELVEPALGIIKSAPESSYEEERLIREAFDTVERHRGETDEDRMAFICGNLKRILESKSSYRAGKEQVEAMAKFAEVFVKFYARKKERMTSLYKKDVINAFAYEYGQEMWAIARERVTEDRKEGTKVEGEKYDQ